MIDTNFKPHLIEVFLYLYQINHTPSFVTDSKLDLLVKKNVLLDTFILLKLQNEDDQKLDFIFKVNIELYHANRIKEKKTK